MISHFLLVLLVIIQIIPDMTHITLNLEREEVHFSQTTSLKSRILASYRKNFSNSNHIENSTKRSLTNTLKNNNLTLSNIFNIHYNVKLYIGNPKQEFRLILDTGSNWIWVGSELCENCYSVGMGDLFQCSKSDSCIADKTNHLDIHYGIGYVSGFVSRDTVSFNKNDEDLSVENQEFLQIEKIQDIEQLKGEGLLGIGKKGYDPVVHSTYMENMKNQGKIEKNMFSLYLLGHECKEDSKIVIGGYDENLFEGDITYILGNDEDFWNIPIELLFFSKEDKQKTIDSVYKTALIDSGSSEIVLKSADLVEIIEYFKSIDISCELLINYQNVPQLTCEESRESKYPDFNVIINKTIFTIKPQDYIANCYFRSFKYMCRLHFIVDDHLDIEEIIILGETFLNVYYSIYDFDNNMIGLAKAKKTYNLETFSDKMSYFKIFGVIIISNLLLLLLEYLCVNLKLCAKIESLNFVEKIFKDFNQYPDLLIEEVNEKNEH